MAHPDPAVVGDVWKAPVRWQNAQRMKMIVEACMMMFSSAIDSTRTRDIQSTVDVMSSCDGSKRREDTIIYDDIWIH